MLQRSTGHSGGPASVLPILAAGLGLALMACGSNQALLSARMRTEAEELQGACSRTGLVSSETKLADEHLASAQRLEKDGEAGMAGREADLAAVLYRLALSRRELSETESALAALKTSLAKDKDQLQTYQQVLEEVKTKRTP